jgi:hypothetical protein
VVLVLGVVGLVPVAAGAQSTGPRFTGEFQRGYDAGAPIDASGAGCPATGGPPSATPPGVFVAGSSPEAAQQGFVDDVGVDISVSDGQVVFTPDGFWTGIYEAIFFPVNADGTWIGVMPHGLPAGIEDWALAGLCTTLLRLTEDGQSIDPASIEEATFVSPAFAVWVIPYQPSTTTTTTSTTSPSAPAVQANPRFTG